MTAVVARSSRDVITVEGPEAIAWLQGQLSQDVADLAVGEVTWSFVLAPQGKVDGWGRVLRRGPEAIQIDVDPGAGPEWVARLNRFKLRTKADVVLRTDVEMVSARGSQPSGWLPAGWPGSIGGDLLLVDSDLDGALASPADLDATPIDDDGFEARRIRAGVPRWGAELDGETIPATIGQWAIDASVSFTKGCFTGQELVARIDSRGGNVPRRLAVLTVAGPPPPPGTEVSVDGEAIGTVTSSATDVESGDAVALLFVPRKVDLPVTAEVAGRPATVALPPA